MKEWSNPYNPFNSMKVLMFSEWLEACAKGEYLPPPMVDIDPSTRCNFNCSHCNAWEIRNKKENDLPEEHLIRLADFLKEWGVQSACISGGGEPFMNAGTTGLIERLQLHGIQSGVITNGSLLNDDIIHTLAVCCRWVGFSVDAFKDDTYKKIKGIDNDNIFSVVIRNIDALTRQIRSLGTECDVAFKFLLMPENACEIYDAAELAKEIGVNDFHLRPACWDNIKLQESRKDKSFKDVMDSIDRQLEKAMKLETDNFHIYGIRHKFNPNFTRKINFSKCHAIPMLPTFGGDGNVHTCFDRRGDKKMILCKHYPNPKEILSVWNTEKHNAIINNINPHKCPRCTFGIYNEVVEHVFINDEMCRRFL